MKGPIFITNLVYYKKRNHVSLYMTDCIAKLQYHFNRAISKCNTFIRQSNYYKKIFLHFFFTKYKYRNEWKEHKFWRQKNQ